MAYGAALGGYPQRYRPRVQPVSLFPAFAVLTLALLWLPSSLSAGDFSLAFLIPFIILGWALVSPGSSRSARRALRGSSGYGLWIELGCVSITLVLAAASMMYSPEPDRAFRVILPMLYGLCAITVLPRLTARQCRRVAYGLLAAGALVLVAGIIATQQSSLRHLVIDAYRFSGFFDNANQLGLTIIALMPLSLALLLSTSRLVVKALCLATTLVLFYALVLTGAKAALAIGFISASLLYLYHSARNDRLWKIVTRVGFAAALLTIAVPVTLWIISWATPVAYEKILKIFTGGIPDYPSIQSRNILWEEAWRLGVENPWTGTGAGSHILGRSHSHNLILDYFRGVGAFGAFAMLVLLATVAVRAMNFYRSTLHKGAQGKWLDTIIVGLYLGALGYIIGNQLSDSLSPSTSFFFWVVYTTAYVSAEAVARVARLRRFRIRGSMAGNKNRLMPMQGVVLAGANERSAKEAAVQS